jgi:hypothetical protein
MNDPALRTIDLSAFGADTIRPLEGASVVVTLPSGKTCTAVLRSLVEHPAPTPLARAPFSFVLEMPRTASTPQEAQGMIAIEHETLGRLEVFAVPLQPSGDVAPWEVVFN